MRRMWPGPGRSPRPVPGSGSSRCGCCSPGSPARSRSREMPGCFWRGLRLTAIDGSTLDVPNSPENRAAFDGPSNDAGPGAFPQVRLRRARRVRHQGPAERRPSTATGPPRPCSAARLFDSFGPGMLVLADRNFLSWKLWRDAAATGAAPAVAGQRLVHPAGRRAAARRQLPVPAEPATQERRRSDHRAGHRVHA